jgi:hypothetical protein
LPSSPQSLAGRFAIGLETDNKLFTTPGMQVFANRLTFWQCHDFAALCAFFWAFTFRKTGRVVSKNPPQR